MFSSLHRPTHTTFTSTYTPSSSSLLNQPLPAPMVKVLLEAYDAHSWDQSSDALTDWLNSRWRKSGYQVSRETVCFTLRVHGRNARMGGEDNLEGAFLRLP